MAVEFDNHMKISVARLVTVDSKAIIYKMGDILEFSQYTLMTFRNPDHMKYDLINEDKKTKFHVKFDHVRDIVTIFSDGDGYDVARAFLFIDNYIKENKLNVSREERKKQINIAYGESNPSS